MTGKKTGFTQLVAESGFSKRTQDAIRQNVGIIFLSMFQLAWSNLQTLIFETCVTRHVEIDSPVAIVDIEYAIDVSPIARMPRRQY